MPTASLPPIPAKRYFSIGEVALLCGVTDSTLRYWEGEFPQLRPIKRSGNRRFYQHHEVLLIRRIRALLYDHRFTIEGARQQLAQGGSVGAGGPGGDGPGASSSDAQPPIPQGAPRSMARGSTLLAVDVASLREELMAIQRLLGGEA